MEEVWAGSQGMREEGMDKKGGRITAVPQTPSPSGRGLG